MKGMAVAALIAAVAAALGCGAPVSGRPVEELWAENCVRCHAADGRGNPAQRPLDPGVDLGASKMVAARARALVFQRIAYGYGGMPGFSHKLERGDLELLVDFVLRLNRES
ncbi:MAG: cytochrome c [Thermoanaerobaculia bacterium]|nr:MAG: cytochrome c [Thermoanaerobaculia bacterium]